MIKLNKAAMFGLDARIALAIFGALSVISGASLYSAIQEARVTAFHTELLEIGKAWEQYYLDTGIDMPLSSDQYRHTTLLIEDTVESYTAPNWNGPYLSGYEKYIAPWDYMLKNKFDGGALYLFTLNDNSWDTWNPNGICTAGQSCYVWIATVLTDSSYINYAKALDINIDGAAGYTTGNIRWDDAGKVIYIKYAPIKNPN